MNIHIEYAMTSAITIRWSLLLRETVNQTTFINTSTLRSHSSYSKPSHHIGAPRRGADSLSPTGARSGPSSSRGPSRDGNRANIHFKKGKTSSGDGYVDSKSYSYVDTDTDINPCPTDEIRTIPELESSPVDEAGLGLIPVNTRSDSDLGEAMPMTNIKGAKNIPRAPSVTSSAGDLDERGEGGSGGAGAPVYKSKSTSTSAATVGVRASISSAVIERGSVGLYSMKDLDLALV